MQVRLGVTTNVAWFFYVNPKRWNPEVWLNQYDTLHLLIGHRIDIDPRLNNNDTEQFKLIVILIFRYKEAKVFDDENIKYLDMNIAMMFRYIWYGTFDVMNNGTIVDMDQVNNAWIQAGGDHDKFVAFKYV